LRSGRGVEVSRRLVGEHHVGTPGDGAGDGNPLALAPGQLTGPVPEPVAEPDPVKRRDRGGTTVAGPHAPAEQADRHRLHRVQLVEQVELLEDETAAARAQAGQFRVGQPGPLLAADPDAAAGWPFERSRHVQQRRLARPRGSDHRRLLGGTDRQAYRGERLHRRRARIRLEDVMHFEHCSHDDGTSTSMPTVIAAPDTWTRVSEKRPVRTGMSWRVAWEPLPRVTSTA